MKSEKYKEENLIHGTFVTISGTVLSSVVTKTAVCMRFSAASSCVANPLQFWHLKCELHNDPSARPFVLQW